MDYNKWNNYTAIGYLLYALRHYNEVAGLNDNECRKLTDSEKSQIIGCMRYSFDMLTLQEAYELS